MCTSLTLKTKDNNHLLGRNMDFAIEINQSVHFIPRNYAIKNIIDNSNKKTKYACLGMGSILNNNPILADGLNEKGLMCATLYLPGYTEYEKELLENKENVAPYDIVLWILSRFESIEEVKLALKNLNIVDSKLSLLGIAPPLHWIVSDGSGKSIVIEKNSNGLDVLDNPVGVMTNSPNFNWHLTNLKQYIGMTPNQLSSTKFEDLTLDPLSQGTGTFGLPGDFTSPSRFVRACYLKDSITNIDTEIDGVTAMFHILSNCSIPKGAVKKSNGNEDITLYTSVMCCESGTYYYTDYDNSQITAVNIFKENLDSDSIKTYPYRDRQAIFMEN